MSIISLLPLNLIYRQKELVLYINGGVIKMNEGIRKTNGKTSRLSGKKYI